MTKLLQWLTARFSGRTYGHDLETFITNKNPTNHAEIDYWTRWYETNHNPRGF